MVITKTKIFLIVCFLVTFAAGLVMGLVWSLPEKSSRRGGSRFSSLNLTPEQKKQMDAIWSETFRATMDQGHDERQKIQEERDQAIQNLLGQDLGKKFEEINEKFHESMDELHQRRRKTFEAAQEQTRQILTSVQRKQYDEMLKKRSKQMRRRPGGWSPRGGPDGGKGRPHRRPPREKSRPEKTGET